MLSLKKLSAILLILLFLFNFFGYRVLIVILQSHTEHRLESLIDNEEYKEDELIEIRLSVNMPYQLRFTQYEKFLGHVTIKGEHFFCIKRKLEGNSLIFQCIPNKAKTRLQEVADHILLANSAESNKQSSGKSAIKIFNPDCEDPDQPPVAGITETARLCFRAVSMALPAAYTSVNDRPPQNQNALS